MGIFQDEMSANRENIRKIVFPTFFAGFAVFETVSQLEYKRTRFSSELNKETSWENFR